MKKNIDDVINQIDALFTNYNRSTRQFTVDYDEAVDGLYCHYTPYINDCGYAVSDILLYIYEASQADLEQLKEYLDKQGICFRDGCEWDVIWGWKD